MTLRAALCAIGLLMGLSWSLAASAQGLPLGPPRGFSVTGVQGAGL